MLTVHHLGISQSERIVWLAEELGLDYEFRRYKREGDNPAAGPAPEEYKALHPTGMAPVITDGDLVLAESGAICDYIVAKYGNGRLVPSKDSPDFADHLFWFHFANGTLMTSFMMAMAVMMSGGDQPPAFVTDRLNRAWGMMEKRLGEAEYFGGRDLTTADIMMVWSLTTGRMFSKVSLAPFPNIRRYLEKIGQRPAYRAAVNKAEPGMEPHLS